MKTICVAIVIASLPCGVAELSAGIKYEMVVAPAEKRDAADGWEEAAARLMGAAAVEELSEEVMEKFSSLHDKPLDLNAASRGRLLSSGLMSVFQVDAFLEYRAETGDVLSFAELSLVPGFNEGYTDALRHFTVLKSSRAPGQKEKKAVEQTLTLRGALRRSDGTKDSSAGLKYAAQWGERAELRWSTRTTYDDGSLKLGTTSAAIYGKRALGKIVLGNFNARFGQGLAQWSGFSLSGFPTVASFRKNGTGLSPTGSFVADTKGMGMDWRWGHLTFSTAASLSKTNIASISNITWTGKRSTVGATCVWAPAKKTTTASVDWHAGLKQHLSLFGEAAVKFNREADVPADPAEHASAAAVAGAIWTPEYGTKLALQCRYYSPSFKSDWSGAVLGFENAWMSATADAARNIAKEASQFKTVIQFKPAFAPDSLTSVKPSVRINARWKPGESNPMRLDLRGDISLTRRAWILNGRYNALWCDGFAWLWYAEAGRSRVTEKRTTTLYTRFSLFKVDEWDDRIYVYERDAPGSFNVPAYYGRGCSVSLTATLKKRRHALHLRISNISYPWNLTTKPSRFEFKAQYTLKI